MPSRVLFSYLSVVESFSICHTAFDDGHADSLEKLLHLHISFSVYSGVFYISLSIDLALLRAFAPRSIDHILPVLCEYCLIKICIFC